MIKGLKVLKTNISRRTEQKKMFTRISLKFKNHKNSNSRNMFGPLNLQKIHLLNLKLV